MLGIDVSKDLLECTLVHDGTRDVIWRGSVPNTATGVDGLLRRIPSADAWVMEPTGKYSLEVAKLATSNGRSVLVAPPVKAKAFRRSGNTRAKTDPIDSYALALFALSLPLRPYPIKSDLVDELDQLLRARRGIGQSITRLTMQLRELKYAAAPLQAAIKALEDQRGALDRQIGKLVQDRQSYPAPCRLLSLPGFGSIVSAAVGTSLQARRFAHSDQFVAFIGLDIATVQSGRRKGNLGLTKQGDAELRRLLYVAACVAVQRTGGPFRAHYEREIAKGLPKTAAYCSVARKLARMAWAVVAHETEYDVSRVYNQPAAVHRASAGSLGQPQ